MNNYLFLLPLYNDWESLLILHEKINDQMGKLKKRGKILIINDFSNNEPPIFKKYENIDEVQIINLNKNLGSQKSISVGLKYLKSSTNNTIITILDSDGEDDVNKIPDMINEAENNPKKIIVSTRTKRQENSFFRAAYFFHKFLTFILTFEWISYGNFSSFHSSQITKILSNNSSWLAISSSFAKNCEILKIKAERKKRLIGKSKLSVVGLISHSLRINCVFLLRVIFLSIIYCFFIFIFFSANLNIAIIISLIIVFYNIMILFTLIKNRQKDFNNSLSFIKNK